MQLSGKPADLQLMSAVLVTQQALKNSVAHFVTMPAAVGIQVFEIPRSWVAPVIARGFPE
jgi:hypothetical protein